MKISLEDIIDSRCLNCIYYEQYLEECYLNYFLDNELITSCIKNS